MKTRRNLRKGNYVVYSNEIVAIGEIFNAPKTDYDPEGIAVHLLHLNGNRYDLDLGRSAMDLNPLPIKSDYLLQAGFEKIGDKKFFRDGVTVIIGDTSCEFLFGNNHTIGHTEFLELQNTFYDFTGVELAFIH